MILTLLVLGVVIEIASIYSFNYILTINNIPKSFMQIKPLYVFLEHGPIVRLWPSVEPQLSSSVVPMSCMALTINNVYFSKCITKYRIESDALYWPRLKCWKFGLKFDDVINTSEPKNKFKQIGVKYCFTSVRKNSYNLWETYQFDDW